MHMRRSADVAMTAAESSATTGVPPATSAATASGPVLPEKRSTATVCAGTSTIRTRASSGRGAAVAVRPDIVAAIGDFIDLGFTRAPYRIFGSLEEARRWVDAGSP